MKNQKRFKTKQEFTREFGEDFRERVRNTFTQNMHYLFGLPYYGSMTANKKLYPELRSKFRNVCWSISEDMLTDKPHPYEDKSLKLKVTPEESEMVQKKAFALGYNWGPETQVMFTKSPYLFLGGDKIITHMPEKTGKFEEDENIEITPQQFMDGDLPEISCDFGKGDSVSVKTQVRTHAKPDAYVDSRCDILHVWENNTDFALSHITNYLQTLYEYNLMSEEDFKKKHQPEPGQLMFREWNVDVGSYFIRLYCPGHEREAVPFSKSDLQAFLRVKARIDEFDAPLEAAQQFLLTNKDKLGLI